jgi:1-deoxy-D-xylulose-5-phosphate synthase
MDAFPFLSQVTEPRDLHRLKDKELLEVANEVRQAILARVSETGGHFSSNLGTVELTVALYASYVIPPDKVIWDTGHQAYPHKMLTGRLDRFGTLRKYKGISGFLRRDEHPLDVFGAGHAGTAISAALGFAVARDRLDTGERVVAVTGDAAICSGMSWEALSHAGDLCTDLTVVLNDNRMSIAPNVGAWTRYFTRLRSRPEVQQIAKSARRVVAHMPPPVERVAAGLRHSLTHYFAPEETGTIFEELGFEYIGPVDGHNLLTLLEIFRNLREVKGPVFVHALTVKGKGYEVAEEDSRKWHGVIPFDLAACEMVRAVGAPTYTQAFGDTAIECAKTDPSVVAITAAMPDGTGLVNFAKEFPERYYDTGIAEQHAVTFAAGLAAGGLRPFCAIYSTFLQRGYDQVLHDVCIQNLPVRFFLDRAGFAGDDGPTHHGTFDLSYLLHMPNMTVAAPRDTAELAQMVRFAAAFDQGPIAVRYPRGGERRALPEARTAIRYAEGEILRETNNPDIAIIAIGSMVGEAFYAAELLSTDGIEAVVFNARFAKPLDDERIIELARRARGVVTAEENVASGGFGDAVRRLLASAGLAHRPFRALAVPDAFVEHGPQATLLDEVGLTGAHLAAAVRSLIAVAQVAGRRP